jgi:hypothetical protein
MTSLELILLDFFQNPIFDYNALKEGFRKKVY